jgi:hypothetical protein
VADRLKVGDESRARLLLRVAMRCSPEYTLFALSIPCGAGAGKVGSRAAEIGLEIAMAAEASRLVTEGAPSGKQTAGAGMPPLMRLCAQLCLAGKLAAAAEWANLVRATSILRRSITSADHLAPLHLRVATSGSPYVRSSETAHAPSHDFQEAVAHLLHDDEETAAFAAAALLNTVAHKRREAQAAHNWDQVYDALVVEARVCLLRQLHAPAMSALRRARRLAGRHDDPQLICLDISARDAALGWQEARTAMRAGDEHAADPFSSAEYHARYQALARTLDRLASSSGPPPSQCIAPFSSLVSPLDARVIRLVAASAARREEMSNAAQGLAAFEHPPFGYIPAYASHPPRTAAGRRSSGAYALAGSGHERRVLVVAYVTSEWGDNSVGKEMAAVIARHDRRRFQPRCYALAARLSPSAASREWRDNVRRSCEGGLQDLSDDSAQEAAGRINEDGAHVLVDLNGWMPGHRAAVLALQPAPVQLGYKNYVGTVGARWEGFIMSDRWCSPPDLRRDFSECLRQPSCGDASCMAPLPHPHRHPTFDIQAMAKGQLSSPNGSHHQPPSTSTSHRKAVIANFNNWKKFDPDTVALWVRCRRLHLSLSSRARPWLRVLSA